MHAADFCIVVAEDDSILRYCTARLLRRHGYKIIEARDGLEALELIEKCDEAIHLLVTDHNMPRMNGAELIGRLKERYKNLMVLVISGVDHEISGDYIEVLRKPYNEGVLAMKVRELLRRGAAS